MNKLAFIPLVAVAVLGLYVLVQPDDGAQRTRNKERLFGILRQVRNCALHAYFWVYRFYIKWRIKNAEEHLSWFDFSVFKKLTGPGPTADEIEAYVGKLLDRLQRIDKIEIERFSSPPWGVENLREEFSTGIPRGVQSPLDGRAIEHSSGRGEEAMWPRYPDDEDLERARGVLKKYFTTVLTTKHRNERSGDFLKWMDSVVERRRVMRLARGNLRLRLGMFDTEAEYQCKRDEHRATLRNVSRKLYPEKYS